MKLAILITCSLVSASSSAAALYICPNQHVLVRDFKYESDPRLPNLIKLNKNTRAQETAARWLRVEYQQALKKDKSGAGDLVAQIATDPDIRFEVKNNSTGEAQLFSQSFIFLAKPQGGCYEMLDFKLKITDVDKQTIALEHDVSVSDLNVSEDGLQLNDSSAKLLNRQLKPESTGGRQIYITFSGRRILMDKWELRLNTRDSKTLMHWPVSTADAIVSVCRKLLAQKVPGT